MKSATDTKENTMNPATTDACGFTEMEWEKMWNGEKNEATATAHFSKFDDENYCELCDSPVIYSGADDKYGKCGCDH